VISIPPLAGIVWLPTIVNLIGDISPSTSEVVAIEHEAIN